MDEPFQQAASASIAFDFAPDAPQGMKRPVLTDDVIGKADRVIPQAYDVLVSVGAVDTTEGAVGSQSQPRFQLRARFV